MQPNVKHRGDPLFLPALFKHFGINYRTLPNWHLWDMIEFTPA